MKKYTASDKVMFSIIGAIIGLHCISLLLPFFWMVTTSFKGLLEFQNGFFKLPTKLNFDNYKNVLSILRIEVIKDGEFYNFGIPDMLVNSFTIALGTSFFGLLSPILASYIVSKYNFKGKSLLFSINIFVMVIPIVGSLANTLTVYKAMHIYNNLLLYILLPGGPFGFNFLLLHGAYKSIPDSYSEAVFIDGGGHLTVFFKIILPMMMPIFSALFILAFIGGWNDYNASLIFLPSVPNLAYGMYVFQYDSAKYGATLPEILAGFTLCSIPSVILFCSFQGVITKSMKVGGLKG